MNLFKLIAIQVEGRVRRKRRTAPFFDDSPSPVKAHESRSPEMPRKEQKRVRKGEVFKKGCFSEEECDCLKGMISKGMGAGRKFQSWVSLAVAYNRAFTNAKRSAKQLNSVYTERLNPALKRGELSQAEIDYIIRNLAASSGRKVKSKTGIIQKRTLNIADIARDLGRSQNDVKNWVNCTSGGKKLKFNLSNGTVATDPDETETDTDKEHYQEQEEYGLVGGPETAAVGGTAADDLVSEVHYQTGVPSVLDLANYSTHLATSIDDLFTEKDPNDVDYTDLELDNFPLDQLFFAPGNGTEPFPLL